jgi:hypothetical protein
VYRAVAPLSCPLSRKRREKSARTRLPLHIMLLQDLAVAPLLVAYCRVRLKVRECHPRFHGTGYSHGKATIRFDDYNVNLSSAESIRDEVVPRSDVVDSMQHGRCVLKIRRPMLSWFSSIDGLNFHSLPALSVRVAVQYAPVSKWGAKSIGQKLTRREGIFEGVVRPLSNCYQRKVWGALESASCWSYSLCITV